MVYQKILSLDKLISQQEGILAYKVIGGTYLLGDILTDRHDVLIINDIPFCKWDQARGTVIPIVV